MARTDFLHEIVSDYKIELRGFSLDITENGYILILLLDQTDEQGNVYNNNPTYAFEDSLDINEILSPLVQKIKLQKLNN